MWTQTYALARVLARPPVTPPYLLLCFYVTCVAAALHNIALDLLGEGRNSVRYGWLVLHGLQLAAVSPLVWVAGTYPLRAVWPGPNVATRSDVRTHLPCAAPMYHVIFCSTAFIQQIHDAGG